MVLWDYEQHQQYQLEKSYVDRLMCISAGELVAEDDITQSLMACGIIRQQVDQFDDWGWDILSKIYHMGTSNTAQDERLSQQDWIDYFNEDNAELHQGWQSQHVKLSGQKTQLAPPASLANKAFESVLTHRMTTRVFNGQAMDLSTFGSLMYYAFGENKQGFKFNSRDKLKPLGIRKHAPSAGGLHSVQAYVVVLAVEGLKPGVYHYDVLDHGLTHIEYGDFGEALGGILVNQFFVKDCSFGVFLTSHLDKVWWKYKHSRSYREAILDTGHLSQTFLLTATALDCRTWLTGIFHDKQVCELLHLDETCQAPFLFVCAGFGEALALHPEVERALLASQSSAQTRNEEGASTQ